jgi:hypothetical protein
MRRHRLLLSLPLAAAAACSWAASDPAGRWEGEAQVPGTPLPLVLDLARGPAGWSGSITLPGRGVKGAAVDALAVAGDGRVSVALAQAFGGPPMPQPTQLVLRLRPDGRLDGRFEQGGLSTAVSLRRSGDAQVDAPPPQTALPAALAGTWRGRYELGGQPRELTLTLAPPGAQAGPPVGELLIVGKRRTQLPVDRVVAGARFVTLEASGAGIRLEGRWDGDAGSFDGVLLQGPFEAALRLQRDVGSGS